LLKIKTISVDKHFGGSYTTFELSASLSSSKICPNQTIYINVTVTNTGSRPGCKVVQVYVQDMVSSLQRPIRELKGFVKTALLAHNQQQRLSIPLDCISLGYFDDHEDINEWVAEEGLFKVYIVSSMHTIELKLELTESFSWI
jgi:beta-glucosidase